ncbi:MAG: transcriptional regulator NrdR [Bacillota bacterium]|nr:transcriptional regulator NrdR [Bacillota bacterium]
MKCKYCGEPESKVIDSRPTEEGNVIRRRRECISCGKRFTTYEKVETVPVLVVKKDGRRELFDSEKIMAGVIKACEKRPVTIKEVEALVDDVEKQVYNSLVQEISSHEIGEMVMQRLKALDEVAYVRFASVYRQFRDISTFMKELTKLLKEK